jgi:hypothetical protein
MPPGAPAAPDTMQFVHGVSLGIALLWVWSTHGTKNSALCMCVVFMVATWVWGFSTNVEFRKVSALALLVLLGIVAVCFIPPHTCEEQHDVATAKTLDNHITFHLELVDHFADLYGPYSDITNVRTPDGGIKPKHANCYDAKRHKWNPCDKQQIKAMIKKEFSCKTN